MTKKQKKQWILTILSFALLLCLVQSSIVSAKKSPPPSNDKTIAQVVEEDKNFSTLKAALEAAGLTDALNGDGPFTVFAPTNKAFDQLPKGTLESLLLPENLQKLQDILTYHVYPGKLLAKDIASLATKDLMMLNKKPAMIEQNKKTITIDGVKIIMTDIMAKNGVIHVIDAVMLPE